MEPRASLQVPQEVLIDVLGKYLTHWTIAPSGPVLDGRRPLLGRHVQAQPHPFQVEPEQITQNHTYLAE